MLSLKSNRDLALLFIDCYQNSNGKITAIALKLRLNDSWNVYLHLDEIPKDNVEIIRDLYVGIPHHPWIDVYLEDPIAFDFRAYYANRYDKLNMLDKESFLEMLSSTDFVLMDTGEQLAWFANFVKKIKITYSVRSISIAELGDERKYVLTRNYSKSDLNEIHSRIASIKQKVSELILKYGDHVTHLEEYKTLRYWMKKAA